VTMLWGGGARTHRTTHQCFGLHPDLLPDRHCLVASTNVPRRPGRLLGIR
jgi:hypothetical protein